MAAERGNFRERWKGVVGRAKNGQDDLGKKNGRSAAKNGGAGCLIYLIIYIIGSVGVKSAYFPTTTSCGPAVGPFGLSLALARSVPLVWVRANVFDCVGAVLQTARSLRSGPLVWVERTRLNRRTPRAKPERNTDRCARGGRGKPLPYDVAVGECRF